MRRVIIIFITIIMAVMMLGNGCEKKLDEELAINNVSEDNQATSIEVDESTKSETDVSKESNTVSDDTDAGCQFPPVNVPENFDWTASCSNNGNQTYVDLQVRGDSYCYTAYPEPGGDQAVFGKNLYGKDEYIIFIVDEMGNAYSEESLDNFESLYLTLWGFPDGVPEYPIYFTPLPWYPDENWNCRESEDPNYTTYFLEVNLEYDPDMNVKIENKTGLWKTNTVIYNNYNLFMGRTEYYENPVTKFEMPTVDLPTYKTLEKYDFADIDLKKLVVGEIVVSEDGHEKPQSLPELNTPMNFDRKGTAEIGGNPVNWELEYRSGSYYYEGYMYPDGDHAMLFYTADGDGNGKYLFLLKDSTGKVYGRYDIPDFEERFFNAWGFDRGFPEAPISFSPIPADDIYIWEHIESEDADTSTWKVEDLSGFSIDVTCKVDNETGLWNQFNSKDADYDVEILVTEMNPVSTSELREVPIDTLDAKYDPGPYLFLVIPSKLTELHN